MIGTDANTGRHLDGTDHIRQSVRDILLTPLGSRVMRRTYGSLIPELIDQPTTPANRLRIYAATVMALATWEPRLRITRVAFGSATAGGALTLDITAERLDDTTQYRTVTLGVPLGTLTP